MSNATVMGNEAYRKKIERQILEIIEFRLQSRQMQADHAKEIARYILNVIAHWGY